VKLAEDVVESFEALRKYFRTVSQCLERVDAHLGNNTGLVARLVRWEETWEIGAAYVQDRNMLDNLSALVKQLQCAEQRFPHLAEMTTTSDAELFLVLPRLVWLHFLSQQNCANAKTATDFEASAIIKKLLPHRFSGDGTVQLVQFVQQFHRLKTMLQTCFKDSEACQLFFWYKAISNGSGSQIASVLHLEGAVAEMPHLKSGVDAFMRDLERWSMELQRHIAGDWNRLSELLLQCLSGEVGTCCTEQKFVV